MKGLIGLFVILFLMLVSTNVLAVEKGMCAEVSITDINPSSVKANEEFTVGVSIENCGTIIPENIIFEITRFSPYISIKEPIIENISTLSYANSKRFLTFHMKTSAEAEPGDYIFNTRLKYGNEDLEIVKDSSFKVTLIGNKAELGIASLKTSPVLPYEGDVVEMTIRIENTGKGSAKSVRVYAEHPFQGLKQAFIGALDPDEDGPAVLTFIAGDAGNYNIPVVISYSDDLGDGEITANIEVGILEKKSNIGVIITILVLIVILALVVIYAVRKNRAKDRVIHQLLRNNSEIKKK